MINIETNFTYNFITIAGTVLYWGATWNLLDSYFFFPSANRIRNGNSSFS